MTERSAAFNWYGLSWAIYLSAAYLASEPQSREDFVWNNRGSLTTLWYSWMGL